MLLNGVSIVLNGHLQMFANIQRAPMHCKWALLHKHDDCSIRLCPIATFSSANFLNLNLVWMQREDRLVSEEELWPSLTHKISLLCSSAVKGRILLMPSKNLIWRTCCCSYLNIYWALLSWSAHKTCFEVSNSWILILCHIWFDKIISIRQKRSPPNRPAQLAELPRS